MRNPIREVVDIKKNEFSVAVLLFLFFFLVIAVFQSLSPIKKGLFVEEFGADIELYAKLANIVVAALGVVAFTYLYNRLPRQRMIYVICLFFVVGFVSLSITLGEPGALSIWTFYLMGDLMNTLLVAGFWAYATDLSSPDQAKRLFGVVGGGGIVGGLVGTGITKLLLERIGMQGLVFIGAGMMACIIPVIFALEKAVSRSSAFQRSFVVSSETAEMKVEKSKTNAAIEGAKLVMQSTYLAAIVGIMAFYEMASQMMDYQISFMMENLSGVTATQAAFVDVRLYTNVLSVIVQFFLVSFVMRRLGLVAALLVLPLGIFGFSAAFVAVPTLLAASFMNIFQNGVNYSMQQTARESLYVVTTPDEKYKARAFTNMFVQRLAKGLSIFLVMGLNLLHMEIQYLGIITIAVATAMVLCSIFAGRAFGRMTQEMEAETIAA